ncbi:MAG: protein kinase, partial [Myxococcota bacterium]|nr:protein kinase [Myxococcota bacterium]
STQPEIEQFGAYRLTDLLGRGGMASVYRALRSGPMGFAKQVAIKRLHPSLTENESILKALINEARLGGQLKHPNIVEVYEFNKINDLYYMAMEFVDGWTLDRVVRLSRQQQRRIPPVVVVDIAIQICLGLDYAHNLETLDGQEVRVVHRDLKPANIIVGRDGTAKIMDFGIAKAETNLFKTTMGDMTKGTPHYMSPEQVAGDPNLGPSSDLFSLGSVLYELITQKVLFGGESLVAVLFAVAKAKVDANCDDVDKIIPGMGDIVERCVARRPEERYASARELKLELESLRAGLEGKDTVADYLYMLRQELIDEQGLEVEDIDESAEDNRPDFATLIAPTVSMTAESVDTELESARRAADETISEDLFLGGSSGPPSDPEESASLFGDRRTSAETIHFDSPGNPELTETSPTVSDRPASTNWEAASSSPEPGPSRTTPQASATGGSRLGSVVGLLLLLAAIGAGITLLANPDPSTPPKENPTGGIDEGPTPGVGDPRTPTLLANNTTGALDKPQADPTDSAIESEAATPGPATEASQPPAVATKPTGAPVKPTVVPAKTAKPEGGSTEVPAASGKPGFLKIKKARPYFGWVWIDGKAKGRIPTPVLSPIELTPGPHRIQLESSEQSGKMSKPKSVTIRSGKVYILGTYNWETEAWGP